MSQHTQETLILRLGRRGRREEKVAGGGGRGRRGGKGHGSGRGRRRKGVVWKRRNQSCRSFDFRLPAKPLRGVRLFCDRMNCSPSCYSVHGISRQEYWSGLSFPSPGDLPGPGIEPICLMSPTSAGRFFTTSATWEGLMSLCMLVIQKCLTLCDPMDYSLPGFSVLGVLQARILEKVAISFPRGSSGPRD